MAAFRMAEFMSTHGINESLNFSSYLCSDIEDSGLVPDLFCGDFPVIHRVEVVIFVWIAFTSLILAALIGNGVVMFTIIRSRSMKTAFHAFLFSMALADFLVALLNTGSTWTFNFYYDWWYGSLFCRINTFMGVCPTCLSVLSMMVVSHDRCRAIVDPFGRRTLSRKNACLILVLIWTVSSLLALPSAQNARVEPHFFYLRRQHVLDQRQFCRVDFPYKHYYDRALFIICYVIPLFVLAYTYAQIWRTLRSSVSFPESSRAVKMIGFVVVTFMTCWLPYNLYHLLADYLTLDPLVNIYAYIFFYYMAMLATALNPLYYGVFSQRFRLGFIYIFRWLPSVEFSDDHRAEMFPKCLRNGAVSVRLRGEASSPLAGLSLSPTLPPPRANTPNATRSDV